MTNRPAPTQDLLEARGITVGYGDIPVCRNLSLQVPAGKFTVIIGPNACGKSTLLKALVRVLKPSAGSVLLDGRSIHHLPTREVARHLGLLPQASAAPEGISVFDLVARGRHPHQSFLRQWSEADDRAVSSAMALAGVDDLAGRGVDELSGGQRQRVWLAMVLAQESPVLLLDEPTTFLDLPHQVELLDLLATLRDQGRTLVAVLHDLNQAARYADHLVAMRQGAIVAQGSPEDLVTEAMVAEVFDLPSLVIPDPLHGSPLVIPRSRPRPAPAGESQPGNMRPGSEQARHSSQAHATTLQETRP